ncbi:MAG: hypothetical protein ACRD1B_10680 [Thermoanaerobaculia bacterium]
MRGQTEVLRIRKQAVLVELALAGSEARQVEVFLAEHQAHEFRRQHVIDLLQSMYSFLPARDGETGLWELFNKDVLMWIRVRLAPLGAEEAESEDDELFDFRKNVRVDLMGGSPLQGELLYSAPEESTRTADYLNLEGRFFHLWQEGYLYLVNKSFVQRIVELA